MSDKRMMTEVEQHRVLRKLTLEEYGWREWVDDPWGSKDEFLEWRRSTPESEVAVYAVNETRGRHYLTGLLLRDILYQDWEHINIERIVNLIGFGDVTEYRIRTYCDHAFDYPFVRYRSASWMNW